MMKNLRYANRYSKNERICDSHTSVSHSRSDAAWARQVGNSPLARKVIEPIHGVISLDLVDLGGFAKLQEPQASLKTNTQHMICFDEIQGYPRYTVRCHRRLSTWYHQSAMSVIYDGSGKL